MKKTKPRGNKGDQRGQRKDSQSPSKEKRERKPNPKSARPRKHKVQYPARIHAKYKPFQYLPTHSTYSGSDA